MVSFWGPSPLSLCPAGGSVEGDVLGVNASVLTKGDMCRYTFYMLVRWSPEKNKLLLETRGLCFEMVLEKISEGDFLGPEVNPARTNQYRLIVFFDGYPFVVPFTIDEEANWFLKTIYPSRKEKKRLEKK